MSGSAESKPGGTPGGLRRSNTSSANVGGLTGYGDAVVENSYRSDEQSVSKSTYGSLNTLGDVISHETLLEESFFLETLCWNQNVWNFTEGEYPALKIQL